METISSAILLRLLQENYAVKEVTALRPITSGEENRNFFVSTDREQYVLRVYSTHHSTTGERKLPEIEFELDFMEAAQANGVPTPPVVRTRSGERVTTVSLENRAYFVALFGYAHGEEPPQYTADIARTTAGLLLSLRRAGRTFRAPCPRHWPGDIVRLSLDYYAMHRDQITHHRELFDRLHKAASTGYAQIVAANLPTGVIHGDVKLGNLLFQGSRLTAVIDFDDFRETFLLEEFTRTVMHDLDSPTRNPIRVGVYSVFRNALAADPTVEAEEIAHLSTFLRARLVYDLAAYTLAGHSDLVDEVLTDSNVQAVLLSGL